MANNKRKPEAGRIEDLSGLESGIPSPDKDGGIPQFGSVRLDPAELQQLVGGIRVQDARLG